ncbi:DUF104 domain-containing protein [candidate division KSB1 bacterium]|nr:DUF104 domain-containing protein [candidate division KSB1 bacterium]
MNHVVRTIEAVFEKGYLRPLEPLESRAGLVYLVTVLDVEAFKQKPRNGASLRGKYRGVLSSSAEFSRNKQAEKALEL